MAEITAALVKDLREKTGAGMMDCKRALSENGGDLEAATDWLRAKGIMKAGKTADRIAAEGVVALAYEPRGAGMVAAAVEVNAETDFVARNEQFQDAARSIAKVALTLEGAGTPEALTQAHVGGQSVDSLLTDLIAKIGEKMVARRVRRFEVSEGVVAAYVHNKVADDLGRIGVLVAVEGAGDKAQLNDLGRKIAMHIAATNPQSLSVDDLDPAVLERERGILVEKARGEGRPDNMIEKIVGGQINKFQRDVVLLKQAFVMNPDQSVEQLVADTAKALGSPVAVTGFVRMALGEGVEKKSEDFAAEVAAVTGQLTPG